MTHGPKIPIFGGREVYGEQLQIYEFTSELDGRFQEKVLGNVSNGCRGLGLKG